ncbi:MAG: DUF4097 family beta strand repeat-containing protein [Acetatifactor sp.]
MGKFLKNCFLIALLLIVLGAGLSIAAGMIGGMESAAGLVSKVSHGLVSFDPGDWKNFQIGWFDDDEMDQDSLLDALEIDKNHSYNTSGSQEKISLGREFTNLDFEIGGAEVTVKPSEDENYYIEAGDFKYFQSYVEDQTLYVKTIVTATGKDAFVTFYVPENGAFSQVDIELGAGKISLPKLVAEKISLEIGAGMLSVEGLQAKTVDVEVGAGAIELEDIQVGDFVGSVGMGSLRASGSFQGNVSAECSMGNLEINVTDLSFEDYNYDIECAMGEMQVGDRTWNDIAAQEQIDHQAEKTMELSCAMGRLEVSFP